MVEDKQQLIKQLTGVNSSKLNYYLELKKRNEEINRQNHRLEIIHQIIKDINIDMSLEDVINRTYQKLPLVLPCDYLGLALLEGPKLCMSATVPQKSGSPRCLDKTAILWQCVQEEKPFVYENLDGGLANLVDENIVSLMTHPLFLRDKVIGVLALGSKEVGVYSKAEMKFCSQLADQMAVCIKNSCLYEQVLRGKRDWEETFAAVADPIFMIDLKYNLIRSNNRDLPFFADKDKRMNDQHKCYQRIWGREEKCTHCLMDQVVSTGKVAHRQVQFQGSVGDVYYYPVFNQKKEVYAVIHHIQDITDKVKIEAQLIQSAKLAAIGEMAAGVAHELNSPMTVIIGTAQMLLRNLAEEDKNRDLLQDIANCGLRCKKIIQNLLTFSRQEQQPMQLLNLNEQVEKVLSMTQYQINRNKIEIKVQLYKQLPLVMGNSQQLQQVLINLLLNARDALENIERERIIKIYSGIGPKEDQKNVFLTVEDSGEGIDKDNLDKIFNPFYTSKGASKGTGLGLSVSLGIAQAHGGRIEVTSNLGLGSKFSLILPVDRA